jgi:hypothetical protein
VITCINADCSDQLCISTIHYENDNNSQRPDRVGEVKTLNTPLPLIPNRVTDGRPVGRLGEKVTDGWMMECTLQSYRGFSVYHVREGR